jgi:hypothetical protein
MKPGLWQGGWCGCGRGCGSGCGWAVDTELAWDPYQCSSHQTPDEADGVGVYLPSL